MKAGGWCANAVSARFREWPVPWDSADRRGETDNVRGEAM